MNNPFESGHIKNYIMLYVGVVVIMVLFFIATSLFHDIDIVEKKVFNTQVSEKIIESKETKSLDDNSSSLKSRFKIMDKSY